MSILTDLVGLTRDSTSDDPLMQAYRMLRGQREEDSANAQPITHKVTYNPDGTQSHSVNATINRPVTPPQDYNAYIAQQESGANPNIGYHDRSKSSAYGTYGITNPAYQDVQAADPRFAGRDITTLLPEEQRAANEVLRAQYAQQLQAKGVDPTEANVRLAHLLGAGGAHQYLSQGTFNQAAMDANGGEEKLRQIAQQRLASAGPSQQAPARPVQPGVQLAAGGATSDVGPTPNEMAVRQLQQQGAMNQPVAPGQTVTDTSAQPGTTLQQVEQAGPPTSAMGPDAWVTRFATAQQDPRMVAQIAYDPNAPKWVREMSEQNLGTQIQNKREAQIAQQLVNKSVETGDMRPLSGAMNKEDGSWVKYYLYNRLGLSSAAQNESVKLGLLDKTIQASGPNGELGLITVNGRGEPKGGVKADGTPLTQSEVLEWASLGEHNAGLLKTAQTQAIQSYASTKNYLEKQAYETKRAMGPDYDLRQHGLAPDQIEATARARADAVMNQARATRTAVVTNAPMSAVSGGVQGGQVATTNEPTAATTTTGGTARGKSIAEKIANYEMPPPASSSGAYAIQMREVSRLNPDYDATKYAAANTTRREFTKLTGTSGGAQVQAINRAIPHSEQLLHAADKLNNGNMPLVNEVLNTFGKNVGDDKVAAARAIQGLVSAELQKAIAGGLGGVEERKHLSDQLSTDLSPQQLKAVIKEFQDMMLASGQGLKQTWTSNGLPEKEFDSKLVPKTRDAFKRHEREANNTRSSW